MAGNERQTHPLGAFAAKRVEAILREAELAAVRIREDAEEDAHRVRRDAEQVSAAAALQLVKLQALCEGLRTEIDATQEAAAAALNSLAREQLTGSGNHAALPYPASPFTRSEGRRLLAKQLALRGLGVQEAAAHLTAVGFSEEEARSIAEELAHAG